MGVKFTDADGVTRDMSEMTDEQVNAVVNQLYDKVPALTHVAVAVCAILEQQYRFQRAGKPAPAIGERVEAGVEDPS